MLVLGIDPDLHKTALALVYGEPGQSFFTLLSLDVLAVPIKLKGDEAAIAMAYLLEYAANNLQNELGLTAAEECKTLVERPVLHPGTGFKKQAGVMKLALVAGSCAAAFSRVSRTVEYVDPAKWKGQVPKEIHHQRLCKRWGLEYTITPGKKVAPKWKYNATGSYHLLDAIGIAEHGLGYQGQMRLSEDF